MTDDVDFDPAKDAANRLKHGLSLDRFPAFDQPPLIVADDRFDYHEVRYRALGRVDGVGYVVVFTTRDDGMRLISFRRAHDKELRRHGI